MPGATRLLQRNAIVYKRIWRGSVFSNFLQPALFLSAMGLGLGPFVDRGRAPLPGNVGYLEFLAPGLLAAACMQAAAFESSWPIAAKMTWQRTYEAITATPMRVGDLVFGELTWIGLRLSTAAIAFTLVMSAFGVRHSPLVLLAIPAAVLTGMAFAAPIVAWAGAVKGVGNSFNILFRFIITPSFLFSGVFFPITRLPEGLQWVAFCTPLFHGVELVRGLALDTLDSPAWIVHVTYLIAMFSAGTVAALWTFTRKLRA